MIVYTTATGQQAYDPQGYAVVIDTWVPSHAGCAHTIGYCAIADWD